VGLAGAGAIAAYVGLDRNCLHGPFADVDPRIRAIWLDHVNEVANWFVLHHRDPERAVGLLTAAVLGIAATLALLWQRGRAGDGVWWTTVLVFALGLAVGGLAARMTAYPLWFEIPPLAVAAGLLAQRYERGLASFAAVGAALLLTPDGWGGISQMAVRALTPKPPATVAGAAAPQPVSKSAQKSAPKSAPKPAPKRRPKPKDYCLNASSYDVLARAPKGLTVSEIDLGPFVLAHTPSSSLSGPYHRLSWGIMAARSILSAPDKVALQRARSLGVTYVLECPVHRDHADRAGLPADALQARLDRGIAPDWLQAMTPLTAPIVVYRIVDPSSPPPAPANTQ
jgi:hypothetical protein